MMTWKKFASEMQVGWAILSTEEFDEDSEPSIPSS